MMACDPEAELAMMITKIWMDPHAGEVAVGRIYSGAISQGESVFAIGAAKPERVQQVSMMVGGDRITVPKVVLETLRNHGIRSAAAGVTLSVTRTSLRSKPFDTTSNSVVIVVVEPKSMKDLPKFIDALPLCKVRCFTPSDNQPETGEALLAGMGELHLEITVYRIEEEQNIKAVLAQIVVYREGVQGR